MERGLREKGGKRKEGGDGVGLLFLLSYIHLTVAYEVSRGEGGKRLEESGGKKKVEKEVGVLLRLINLSYASEDFGKKKGIKEDMEEGGRRK